VTSSTNSLRRTLEALTDAQKELKAS
jgi:hypothetical protein